MSSLHTSASKAAEAMVKEFYSARVAGFAVQLAASTNTILDSRGESSTTVIATLSAVLEGNSDASSAQPN